MHFVAPAFRNIGKHFNLPRLQNTDRVKEIFSWYGSDNPGTFANFTRIMNTDDTLLGQVCGIPAGGSFGSIIGRNSFTRKKEDALKLLGKIIDIYKGK